MVYNCCSVNANVQIFLGKCMTITIMVRVNFTLIIHIQLKYKINYNNNNSVNFVNVDSGKVFYEYIMMFCNMGNMISAYSVSYFRNSYHTCTFHCFLLMLSKQFYLLRILGNLVFHISFLHHCIWYI